MTASFGSNHHAPHVEMQAQASMGDSIQTLEIEEALNVAEQQEHYQ